MRVEELEEWVRMRKGQVLNGLAKRGMSELDTEFERGHLEGHAEVLREIERRRKVERSGR